MKVDCDKIINDYDDVFKKSWFERALIKFGKWVGVLL